jgi:hypothetical protein
MILIDGARIRSKARKAYEKVVRDLEDARKQAGHFRQHDQPAYQHWLHSNFGAILTDIRETSHKLSMARSLVDEVYMESFYRGISLEEAYRFVQARRSNPQLSEEEEEGPDANGAFDEFERLMDELFDEEEPDDQEDFFKDSTFQNSAPKSRTVVTPQEKSARSRVKELYRALVRRLHPDTSHNGGAQRMEWWHMTQAAYLKQDVDQLELILTLCQMDEKGRAEQTSVSLLFRITAHFRSALRSLRKELKQMRGDPAWKFSERNDLEHMAPLTKNQLDFTLAGLRHQVANAEALLESWARPPKPRPRRRRRGSPFASDFF